MFENLDEVWGWMSFIYPVIIPKGLGREENLIIIKITMLKIDNDNAHIY